MATTRVCCFPFAGGGTSFFAGWVDMLPDWVELWGACLPGRESRSAEPFASSLSELAAETARALEPVAGPDLILFGHSMGAVLAYEVARSLSAQGSREPGCLIVSGHGPPWAQRMVLPPGDLSDRAFAEEVQRRFGGIPPELFELPELLELTVHVLKADIELLAAHRAVPRPHLQCPVVAFGGRGDPAVSPRHLGAWKDATVGGFSVRTFPGRHFYMRPDPRELLRTLSDTLTRLQSGSPGRAEAPLPPSPVMRRADSTYLALPGL